MSHDYHDALPGFDPRQLLIDGCAECEHRGRDVALAIEKLDAERFLRAWRRAFDLHASRGDQNAVGPISEAEEPMLSALWTVQIQLERRGVRLTGQPPGAN